MSGGDVMVLIAVAGQFALAGMIVFIVAHRLEQKAALHAQLELKLVERFSTAKELEEFLSTEAGRRLLGGRSRHGGSPLAKIAGTMQVGVALVVVGLGVLVIAMLSGRDFVLASAVLVLALGFGLLAASALGRRLVKAWDLNGSREH